MTGSRLTVTFFTGLLALCEELDAMGERWPMGGVFVGGVSGVFVGDGVFVED